MLLLCCIRISLSRPLAQGLVVFNVSWKLQREWVFFLLLFSHPSGGTIWTDYFAYRLKHDTLTFANSFVGGMKSHGGYLIGCEWNWDPGGDLELRCFHIATTHWFSLDKKYYLDLNSILKGVSPSVALERCYCLGASFSIFLLVLHSSKFLPTSSLSSPSPPSTLSHPSSSPSPPSPSLRWPLQR